jgi:signal transduction histidine kinase
VLFIVTTVGFVVSTVLAARQFRAVTRFSEDISGNAMPSVLHLSALRVALRDLEEHLDRAVLRQDESELARVPETVASARQSMASYAANPSFPGEPELWRETAGDIEEALGKAQRAADLLATERTKAFEILSGEFERASARADADLWNLVDLNVEEARERGRRIEAIRAHGVRFSFLLDGIVASISGLLAVLAFVVLHKSTNALGGKAAEMEQFVGRVAHDIRGPLGAIAFAVAGVKTAAGTSQPLAPSLERAEKGLRRATALLDDLLAFARAGGTPEPGARTLVAPAIRASLDEVADLARQERVELHGETSDETAAVACAPGVLASILSNLVSNAIKYIGDTSERRVIVRSFGQDRFVQIEVTDTGPGVPPGAVKRIFEPFVRADPTGRPGSGLGLATVRRLAQSHGGRAGLVSSPRGSTFWVELPSA